MFALDRDEAKAAAYRHHFQANHYLVEDIATVKGKHIPDVDLAHASFPCTDLSLAGWRRGIYAGESAAIWHFIRILAQMRRARGTGRPPFVLIENVAGLLTSGNGEDLFALLKSLNSLSYRVDLLSIDAAHFVPQSRVRLFIIAVHRSVVSGMGTALAGEQRRSSARPKKIREYIDTHADLDWYHHLLPDLPNRSITLEQIISSIQRQSGGPPIEPTKLLRKCMTGSGRF